MTKVRHGSGAKGDLGSSDVPSRTMAIQFAFGGA
jgi:hypothetical protein